MQQNYNLESFVIQKGHNESTSPDSGYIFKFYRMGKWLSYRVDKYLPECIAAIAERCPDFIVPTLVTAELQRFLGFHRVANRRSVAIIT